ncbi:MAG: FIST C-terminal domain-containing protein [Planctomycetes bacterium]|nr:FIST C-terminal domain-containing protein [Planctomycetota bacterium]
MKRAATALVRDIPEGRAAVVAAIRSASEKLGGSPTAAIVFATPQYRRAAPGILEELKAAGCAVVAGGCAAGVLTDEGEAEGGRAVALMLFSGEGLRAFHEPSAERLRGALDGSAIGLIFPDPAAVDLADLLRGFDAGGEFEPLVGGALSGGTEKSGHFQFAGDRVAKGGVSGATVPAESFAIGVTHGCRPIGKPMVITRAQGHLVLGLAGKPPLEMLRDTLQEHARGGGPGGPVMAGIAMDSSKSPLQRGDFIVRNLIAMKSEEGEVLAVGTPVRTGQTLEFQLMERKSAIVDMQEMVAGVKEDLEGDPAFGFYFNCRGRGKNLYGETDHDVVSIRTGLGSFPLIGFFGNAEFAPVGRKNWLHNYTGVLLAAR